MKRLLVLGAGTAGTMAVNKLRPLLAPDEWSITVVDSDDTHYYQPGFLFVPFGIYRPDEIVKPKQRFIPAGVDLVLAEIDRIVADDDKVLLVDGTELPYDYLIIASGTTPRPEETPGMADDLGGDVHEFYTFAGATRLAEKLRTWEGGRMSSTSPRCRSSARWRRSSSRSWPTPSSRSRACATRSRSST